MALIPRPMEEKMEPWRVSGVSGRGAVVEGVCAHHDSFDSFDIYSLESRESKVVWF